MPWAKEVAVEVRAVEEVQELPEVQEAQAAYAAIRWVSLWRISSRRSGAGRRRPLRRDLWLWQQKHQHRRPMVWEFCRNVRVVSQHLPGWRFLDRQLHNQDLGRASIMPITLRNVPRRGAARLVAHLTGLLRERNVPTGMPVEMRLEALSYSEPHPVFCVPLDALAGGKLLDAAMHASWRYLLVQDERAIAEVELSAGRRGAKGAGAKSLEF